MGTQGSLTLVVKKTANLNFPDPNTILQPTANKRSAGARHYRTHASRSCVVMPQRASAAQVAQGKPTQYWA